ncbi:Glyoxalase/bleomycin resistance protein/dioxygenase (fragment) [Frankia canadensis]|uniref:Glyoxalase/bleomycin resistance protein/dioxygenase n=1 Tax=Frankia canadensis TaxID=1836972 RepID=A0A2I2L2R0_9ACTN
MSRRRAAGTSGCAPAAAQPAAGQGNGPAHREIWLRDPDGYTVVASPDGEVFEPGMAE